MVKDSARFNFSGGEKELHNVIIHFIQTKSYDLIFLILINDSFDIIFQMMPKNLNVQFI